mmetsp:Transcript_45678/g.105419  ORF Transcript_45678/g.105419 Transcript_45678/m.105419 type:complete len:325 (+) Transcript_45678:1013-1987(+)
MPARPPAVGRRLHRRARVRTHGQAGRQAGRRVGRQAGSAGLSRRTRCLRAPQSSTKTASSWRRTGRSSREKANACCVCGCAHSYVRHAVVPHAYRQHFEVAMKSHLSHDVVLLCPSCHEAAAEAMCARSVKIAREFGVPLEHETVPAEQRLTRNATLAAVQRSARALHVHDKALPQPSPPAPDVVGSECGERRKLSKGERRRRSGLPADRREAHLRILADHFALTTTDELTPAHIADACALESSVPNPSWVPHGKKVVDELGGPDEVADFVRAWRRHFVETMKPRFLSAHWSVDARVANSTAAVFGGKTRALEIARLHNLGQPS